MDLRLLSQQTDYDRNYRPKDKKEKRPWYEVIIHKNDINVEKYPQTTSL